MSRYLQVAVGQYSDKGRKELNQDFHGVCIPREPQLSAKGIAVALADGEAERGCGERKANSGKPKAESRKRRARKQRAKRAEKQAWRSGKAETFARQL